MKEGQKGWILRSTRRKTRRYGKKVGNDACKIPKTWQNDGLAFCLVYSKNKAKEDLTNIIYHTTALLHSVKLVDLDFVAALPLLAFLEVFFFV